MTVATAPPNTSDFVALMYLPRIQDTSLQILAGAEQRMAGGRGFRAFLVNIICQLSHGPVWLENEAGKSVGESQRMTPTSVPRWQRDRRRCTIMKRMKVFLFKQKRDTIRTELYDNVF